MQAVGGQGALIDDAIVIGAGHNGLVAANLLADAGWSVRVLEAQPGAGGAVQSQEMSPGDGFTMDRFSAFYPLGYASPVLRRLDLERHGLRWVRSAVALAHPVEDGRCAVLSIDLEETAASLDAFAAGDGDAWRELYGLWERVGGAVVDALTTPFPPVRAGARLARALGSPRAVAEFARFGLLPVRRLAEETFRGEGGGWLLAGNALHADFTVDHNGSGFFGWLLCSLGQQVGFPVPEGGAGRLTEALVRRLEAAGGRVETSRPVLGIDVRGGRATAVTVAGGERLAARRAVLAAVPAPVLYDKLLGRPLKHFHADPPTVKVDWSLDGPIPWTAPEAARAGTVHVGGGMHDLASWASQMGQGARPERPFLVMGQYSTVDPTRCPPGKEVAWAYTHLPDPRHLMSDSDLDRVVRAMEGEVERLAPGFRDRIRGTHIALLGPGAVNLGTAQLHQQLLLRPAPHHLGRPETGVAGLYLASAAAHPGGGVHGAPGSNAARAALARDRLTRPFRR